MPDEEFLGYLKYEGALVEGGIFDARSAADAFGGIDRALRFFVEEQRPGLEGLDIPIPVRVEKGSLVIGVPDDVQSWLYVVLGGGMTAFAAAYANEAAKRLAGNDFKNIGLKDVFRKSFHAILWFVRIARHLGSATRKTISGIKWKDETEVAVPNADGKYLYVPVEYLEMYLESPDSLLSGIVSPVEKQRKLVVRVWENGMLLEENITENDKPIFDVGEISGSDVLLPELEHGLQVKLQGVVTRGNGTTNTLGFRYKDHILTCWPSSGSIVRYKPCLFLPCVIEGTVSRADDHGAVSEVNRPHIIFDRLAPLPSKQKRLFE